MKWLKRIVVALVALVVLAYGTIYARSNQLLNRKYDVALGTVTVPSDSASLVRGERMAHLVGCHGCHTESLAGELFFDEPNVARVIAPNIPVKIAPYSDAEFERLLRRGVRKDGTSPVVMPPPGLYHLSDRDVAEVVAWIRSRPPATLPAALPVDDFRIMGRLGLVIGQFKTAVESIDTTVSRIGDDSTYLTSRRGEYLARVVCTECHGAALRGDPMFPTPSLSQAVGYAPDEFMRLLRTGTSRSNTPLTLMAQTAQHRLHLLTDDEIRAIYDYIKALPASGITSGS